MTGAAGNIGRALRAHLADQGVALVSIDLREPAAVSTDDHVLQTDIGDPAALDVAFDGCDGVVHLAGIADEADFHDLAEVNIVGTYHVLEAARRAGVGRVVSAGSNRVTGAYDVDTIVDESMPPRPDGFYGVSKVAVEALSRLYADKFGLRTVVIRIGSYEAAPSTAREMRTWLSPADALRAFDAAMTTELPHAVFYAVSANRGRWWSAEAGEAVGFRPVDDAARHGPVDAIAPGTPQGGTYATAAYSLERMRAR